MTRVQRVCSRCGGGRMAGLGMVDVLINENVSTVDPTGTTATIDDCKRVYLKAGTSGSCVQVLAAELVRAGYPAVLGTYTYDADLVAQVKRFQKARGLAVDGIVGPQTWAALAIWSGPTVQAKPPKPDSGSGTSTSSDTGQTGTATKKTSTKTWIGIGIAAAAVGFVVFGD